MEIYLVRLYWIYNDEVSFFRLTGEVIVQDNTYFIILLLLHLTCITILLLHVCGYTSLITLNKLFGWEKNLTR